MFLERSKFVKSITAVFEKIAPLSLADSSWDNVGLIYESLVEPEEPLVLMAVDVTEQVIREAVEAKASMVLSYHPPWFRSGKQLNMGTLPVITMAASNGISLYSMHSALDAMPGGVNDWMLREMFGVADPQQLSETQTMGRRTTLARGCTLEEAVQAAKKAFKREFIRVAASPKGAQLIRTVAVCAGSGASVLRDVEADLYVCGEMSHHDILHATSRGVHVILAEHTNTERGYLGVLKKNLEQAAAPVKFILSQVDEDPIKIW